MNKEEFREFAFEYYIKRMELLRKFREAKDIKAQGEIEDEIIELDKSLKQARKSYAAWLIKEKSKGYTHKLK